MIEYIDDCNEPLNTKNYRVKVGCIKCDSVGLTDILKGKPIDIFIIEQKIKCPAGDAVLYPASTRHHITPITRGERLVAVTWVQSLIRNNEQRYLLYQLSHTREKMLRKDPNSEDTKRIDNVYVNLVRMWSEV